MAPLGISEAAVASLKFKQLHFPTGCHLPNSLWLCVCVCLLIWASVFVYYVCVFLFKVTYCTLYVKILRQVQETELLKVWITSCLLFIGGKLNKYANIQWLRVIYSLLTYTLCSFKKCMFVYYTLSVGGLNCKINTTTRAEINHYFHYKLICLWFTD